MFDRTLNLSGEDRPWPDRWEDRSRRGLTTLTSFGLQALAVGLLLLFPLLRPQGLPSFRQLSTPMSLGQPLGDPTPARNHESPSSASPTNAAEIFLREPSRIPTTIPANGAADAPPVGLSGDSIPGASGSGDPRGVPNLFNSGSRPVLPTVRPPAVIAPLRISHMSEGNLIRKVQPSYPAPARSARIQGAVVLQALINKQGAIQDLRVLSGHPMLVPAAIDAVSQWRYRPYILNNEPVEVETQITVNFSLGGN